MCTWRRTLCATTTAPTSGVGGCDLAEVAILAGRLAAEDLGNAMSGRSYCSLALDTAREAADDQLTAIAHGHAAQLAAHEGLTTVALDHLTTAHEYARATPVIASWLATIRADRGDHSAAREAIDRSRAALSQAGRAAPASFHHCSAMHVNAASGEALLKVGDNNGAREALTAALESPQVPRRQRALVLINLATVELNSGNLPEACSHATQAATLLHRVAYAVGAARLRAFRAAAQRPLPNGALRALDEHLTRIAA